MRREQLRSPRLLLQLKSCCPRRRTRPDWPRAGRRRCWPAGRRLSCARRSGRRVSPRNALPSRSTTRRHVE
eukprot:599876-Prymnesium_polylepis.1